MGGARQGRGVAGVAGGYGRDRGPRMAPSSAARAARARFEPSSVYTLPRMNLLERLGVEIGVRTAGSPEAARAADAIAEAFRELGLEPRFEEFPLLGYEADEPELVIEGTRWAAGPCMYAHPTPDGGVTGMLRHIGQQEGMAGFPPTKVWAIEDEHGAV